MATEINDEHREAREAMTTSDKSEATNSRTAVLAAAAAAAALAVPATGRAGEKEDKFLADIKGDDAEARLAAWQIADQMDPEVIPALSQLLVSKKPGVRKAAAEALNHVVHSVGKELDPASLRANRGRPNAPHRGPAGRCSPPAPSGRAAR